MERRKRLNKDKMINNAPAVAVPQIHQQPDVSIPQHQKLLPLAYPGNPERITSQQDLAKHAFPQMIAKQEIIADGGVVISDDAKAFIIGGMSEDYDEEHKIATSA